MNILITGGGGNLGSRLVVPLVQRGDRVILFDIRKQPHVSSPELEESEFIEADLGDEAAVLDAVQANQVDSIFHLGALLSANAEERPEAAWQANMQGTRSVLEAARVSGKPRVIFSSTVATYGAGLPDPLPLDAPQWPVSLYGATKVAGERLGVYYHHRHGLDFRGIRFPAVVAPHGAAGGASAFCSAVFEQAATRGAYEFYLQPDCRCPIVYIRDAIQALLLLHDAPEESLHHRVYNVAGLGPSAEELAQAVLAHLPNTRITYRPDPIRNAIVDSWPHNIDDGEARKDWGWSPEYELDRMAEEILTEFRNGPENE